MMPGRRPPRAPGGPGFRPGRFRGPHGPRGFHRPPPPPPPLSRWLCARLFDVSVGSGSCCGSFGSTDTVVFNNFSQKEKEGTGFRVPSFSFFCMFHVKVSQ